MEPDWTLAYTTNKPIQAQMVKQMLENEGIESIIINKNDSTYLTFGEVEIYVNKDLLEKARNLIIAFEK